MNDQDLEQRLLRHYRAIDPAAAPPGLGSRIGGALESQPSRWTVPAGVPALATALAAVVIIALVAGLRPGGFLSPTGTSPTATPSATPTAVPGSPLPSSSPGATSAVPGGTVPPVSTQPWTTLDLQFLHGGPAMASSVAAWPMGYVGVGTSVSDRGPVPAWISRDGRTWTQLPADTFATAAAVGARTADGVVVLAFGSDGSTTAWRSSDGITWSSAPSPQLRTPRDTNLAGGVRGAVMIVASPANAVAFSPDGASWQTVVLPGGATSEVQGVAAFGDGFVAVGDSGSTTGSPVAWWSADGTHWTSAEVASHPGDGFRDVYAGSGGLVAISSTPQVPGVASFWTSPDGRRWTVSTADPLGTWQQGEGAGSANGLFAGDGNRLLAFGVRADGQPLEYWTSLDGRRWTQLALVGDTAPLSALAVTPYLMRDGVLFDADQQAWFGSPVP